MGQAPDDLTARPLHGLTVEDVPADLPVEPQQSDINRQRGTLLGGVGTALRSASQSAYPSGGWVSAGTLSGIGQVGALEYMSCVPS